MQGHTPKKRGWVGTIASYMYVGNIYFPENILKKIIQNSKENGGRDPLRVTTPKSAYEMGKLGFLLCQKYIGHSCYESLKVS